MGESDTQQALWNFDGAELQTIFIIKSEVVDAFRVWNLDLAYWKLRDLRREIDAKLSRGERRRIVMEFDEENKKEGKKNEKQEVDSMLDDLDKIRSEFIKEYRNDKEKSTFYLKLEEFYMHLCFLMKKHGLYFREGDDSKLAVLRR